MLPSPATIAEQYLPRRSPEAPRHETGSKQLQLFVCVGMSTGCGPQVWSDLMSGLPWTAAD